MGTVSAGRSELYFESLGDGPAVLFAHGVGGNHAGWFGQLRDFSARYQVVSLDQRGFGNSSDAEQAGRTEMANDLGRVMDALKLDRATLVAQSMGGGACIGFTCRHARRVSALVLADTLVGLILPPELEREMEKVRAATANLTQIERVIGRQTRERDPDRAILYSQIASFNRVNLRTIKGEFETFTVKQLAETKVPILFVVGEDDILAPPHIVRAVHELIPGSKFHLITGAGHSAHFEQPAAFNAAVLDYLRNV
jgi:pimeloyl-ACP methyl ester carboxylesterase